MNSETTRLLVADDHALFRDGLRALFSATRSIEIVGEAAFHHSFPTTRDNVSILWGAHRAILVKQEAKMRKVLNWIGFGLAGLLGLAVMAAIVVFTLASAKFNRTYELTSLQSPSQAMRRRLRGANIWCGRFPVAMAVMAITWANGIAG